MSDRLTIRFASDMPAATVEVVSPDLQVVDRVMLNAGRSREVDVPSEQSFLRVHLPSGQVVTLQDPGNLDRKISMAMIRGGSRATAHSRRVDRAPGRRAARRNDLRRDPAVRTGCGRSCREYSEGEAETLPLSSQATVTLTAPVDTSRKACRPAADVRRIGTWAARPHRNHCGFRFSIRCRAPGSTSVCQATRARSGRDRTRFASRAVRPTACV